MQNLPSVARDHGVTAPALIVIGSVVDLHAQLGAAIGVVPVDVVDDAQVALA